MLFIVKPREDKKRIDHVLAARFPEISRSFLQSLCKDNQVLINNSPQKSGYKLSRGDSVAILYDMGAIGKTPEIDIPIVYEDEGILVVNKPAGVLSHALSKFKQEPSVASFLRQHAQAVAESENIRYGIVHRLDRATSGLMICAKTAEATTHLQKQFADRNVSKEYVAVVGGMPKHTEANIDVPIERNPKKPATFRAGQRGKEAHTSYKVQKSNDLYSLVALQPRTGRTHQLRVHMAYINCPIVGDFLYGGEEAERLYLHAHQITLHVRPNQKKTFTAPIPRFFSQKVG
jgi:23S rRNA pseudouridine1911/1915/1917 synthase